MMRSPWGHMKHAVKVGGSCTDTGKVSCARMSSQAWCENGTPLHRQMETRVLFRIKMIGRDKFSAVGIEHLDPWNAPMAKALSLLEL